MRACVLDVTRKTSNEAPHSTFVCIISRVLLFYSLCTSVDPILFCITRFGPTLWVGAFVLRDYFTFTFDYVSCVCSVISTVRVSVSVFKQTVGLL